MYNTYKNNRGQEIPRTPVFKDDNNLSVRRYLMSDLGLNEHHHDISNPWVCVNISASQRGYLYRLVTYHDEDFFQRFISNNDCYIVFDDFEKFKKYLNWTINIKKVK